MFMMIVLGALSLFAAVATVVAVAKDGYGFRATDWTRLPDRDARYSGSGSPR